MAFAAHRAEPIVEPVTHWERVATTRWGRYTTRVEEDAVREALRIAGPPGVALEVGCEGGRWSRLLADAGWRTICTDVDPDALAVCQRRIPDATCILVERRARSLPCPDRSVRLVVCHEVFPVVESDWFLREAWRVLSDGGLLVGVTLNRSSLRGLFVRVRDFRRSRIHVHYQRSYSAWKELATTAGFQLSYERGCCWFPLPRQSDSTLAPIFVALEQRLGLYRLTGVSPWVVFVARKASAAGADCHDQIGGTLLRRG